MAGADLIYVALPVGHTIELLPEIARLASPDALVTDASSTKRIGVRRGGGIVSRGPRAVFSAGIPWPGKEISGIAAADAELFRGSKYALIRRPGGEKRDRRARCARCRICGVHRKAGRGSRSGWTRKRMTVPRRSSRIFRNCLRSRWPEWCANETDETGLPVTLAGRGLRDALRLAGSPYSVWRDIILTNSDNLDRVLDQMIQALEQLRGDLRARAHGRAICRRRRTVQDSARLAVNLRNDSRKNFTPPGAGVDG